jgi:hypothetical protein
MDRLPYIDQFLKESFNNFKNNFVSILLVQLPIVAAIFLILGLSFIYILEKSKIENPKFQLLFIILTFPLLMLLGAFSYLASIIRLRSKELTLLEVYKNSLQKLLPFFLTGILSSLVIFLGSLLLFIPGVIFLIRFYFVPFVASLEGIYYKSALRKSSEYVKGLWWEVFARILILGVILFVILSIFSLILFILGMISPVILYLLSMILNYAASIFTLVYTFTLYNQIKNLKREPNLE